MERARISVVIPVLNEQEALSRLLPSIAGHDVTVVDGGSVDRTAEVAQKSGARVVRSRPGRGVQMNAGAAACSGEILWFLHADSDPPQGWDRQIASALADPLVVGGAFRARIQSGGAGYRFLDAWGALRARLQRSFYGDQGIFVRRPVFDRLRGFADLPVLEDLDFSTRLAAAGKTVLLPGPLGTSARRWKEEGWWRTVLRHSRLALRHALSPDAGLPAAVAIMAKLPEPGKVKTRLVPPLTPEQAAGLARDLLLETADRIGRLAGVRKVVAVSPDGAIGPMRGLVGDRFDFLPQGEGDLGRRMSRLFDRLFLEGLRAVVIVGTDHPGLPAAYLRRALASLRRGDRAVLGPTTDGGYYLVGLNRPHPELFSGIDWSTDRVMRQTLEAAAKSGLPVTVLPAWRDLDRPEDLSRFPAYSPSIQLRSDNSSKLSDRFPSASAK